MYVSRRNSTLSLPYTVKNGDVVTLKVKIGENHSGWTSVHLDDNKELKKDHLGDLELPLAPGKTLMDKTLHCVTYVLGNKEGLNPPEVTYELTGGIKSLKRTVVANIPSSEVSPIEFPAVFDFES